MHVHTRTYTYALYRENYGGVGKLNLEKITGRWKLGWVLFMTETAIRCRRLELIAHHRFLLTLKQKRTGWKCAIRF